MNGGAVTDENENAEKSEAVAAPEADEPKPVDEAEPTGDAMFDVLWKRVIEAWDDDKPHAALLQHALDKEKLPDLAGRYRKLMDDPVKGPRAKKKIDGIVIAATSMLMAMKTPARTKTPWQWTASVGVVCLIVIAWLALKILRHH